MTWQAPFLCGFADKLKHGECPHKSENEGHDMPRFGMQRMLLLEPRVQQLMMVCSDGGVSGEREDDRCAVAHHAA